VMLVKTALVSLKTPGRGRPEKLSAAEQPSAP
jgi:hypothetical protein